MLRLTFILTLSLVASCVHMQVEQPEKDKVVLAHGYGRSPGAMDDFADFFREKGFQVYNVGYSSLTQNIDEIKQEFFGKVDQVLTGTQRKVHFVGHSMGGLLIRSYLGERDVSHLGNVVTLGSPSSGTPVVEYLKDKWYFFLGGPAVRSLSSEGSDFLASLKPPTYNLGVVAGVSHSASRLGFFQGPSDGLVPLESTRVKGAKGFIVLPVSHHRLRSDKDVMSQVFYFLVHSRFMPTSPFPVRS